MLGRPPSWNPCLSIARTSQNVHPLYWNAGLDDNSDATAEPGAQGYQTVDRAQGECRRGTVDVEVPDGRTVASVYLTSPGLSEIARWNLDEPATDIPGPLTPTGPPQRTPIGTAADTASGPATAYGVTDGVAPADFMTVPAGHTLTGIALTDPGLGQIAGWTR